MKLKNKVELENVYNMLAEKGYDVAYLAVQGSQNYNLELFNDEYQSDVDMKGFYVPTYEEVYYNSDSSGVTYETEYGLVTLYSLRSLDSHLKKANPVMWEVLLTDNYLVSESAKEYFDSLKKELPFLFSKVRKNFAKALYGHAKQKVDGLYKMTDAKKDKMENFGYDPKELHHLFRLMLLSKKALEYGNLSDTVEKLQTLYEVGGLKEFFLKLKLGFYDVSSVDTLAELAMNELKSSLNIVEKYTDEFSHFDTLKSKTMEFLKEFHTK